MYQKLICLLAVMIISSTVTKSVQYTQLQIYIRKIKLITKKDIKSFSTNPFISGQTVDIFRSRWNNCKDNSKKLDREDCMQRHLYKHSQLPRHTGFLEDTYVALTDKTDPGAPTKCEDYRIHTLKQKCLWNVKLKMVTGL